MKSIDVAKDIVYWLKYYAKSDPAYIVSNTKLQKLLYLVFGFALINDIRPLEIVKKDDGLFYASVIDELPRAWPYGPVFQNVYKSFTEIEKLVNTESYKLLNNEELLKKIIQNTSKDWGRLPAYALTNWSHQANSPWDNVVNTQQKPLGTCIDAVLVKEYFQSKIKNIL